MPFAMNYGSVVLAFLTLGTIMCDVIVTFMAYSSFSDFDGGSAESKNTNNGARVGEEKSTVHGDVTPR